MIAPSFMSLNVVLAQPPISGHRMGGHDGLASSHYDSVHVGRTVLTPLHTRSVSQGEPRCTGLKTLWIRVGAAM